MGRFLLSLENMRTMKSTLRSLGLLALSLTLVQCSDLNAEKVKKDFNAWFTDLITPRNSSLEMANEGYIVKGNLKNKPNQVVTLYEMTPENLIFIDSIKTDKKGDFTLKGNTKELIFCALSVADKQMVYLALDNATEINVMADATASGVVYSLTGKKHRRKCCFERFAKTQRRLCESNQNLGNRSQRTQPKYRCRIPKNEQTAK